MGKNSVSIVYKKTTQRKFAGTPYRLLVARVPSDGRGRSRWVIRDAEMRKLHREGKKLKLIRD